MVKYVVIIAVLGFLGGCSILMPYDEKFACEANAEFGKCTNVEGAYSEAVTGKPSGPTIRNNDDGDVYLDYEGMDENEFDFSVKSKRTAQMVTGDAGFEENNDIKKASNKKPNQMEDPYLVYKNSVYRELSGLINLPNKTPMVKQPTQVRTLVLSYATESHHKPLYMPRYVYFMLEDYIWVMNGRLLDQKNHMSAIFGE